MNIDEKYVKWSNNGNISRTAMRGYILDEAYNAIVNYIYYHIKDKEYLIFDFQKIKNRYSISNDININQLITMLNNIKLKCKKIYDGYIWIEK